MFAEAARQFGIPQLRFSLPAWYWQRSAIFIFGFPVSENPEENRHHREAFFHLIEVCGKHGWAEYRTGPVFQDAVARQFSFNNHSLMQSFSETVKRCARSESASSLQGRYGIWPKHLRKKKADANSNPPPRAASRRVRTSRGMSCGRRRHDDVRGHAEP